MKLEKITFSGVDCNTHLPTLQKMATEFPKMEFGILLSASRAGKDNKYPDYDTIVAITKIIPKEQLSLHLCGSVCKALIDKGILGFPLLKKFSRVQLNFDLDDHPFLEYIKIKNILYNQEIIIQLHGRNGTCIPMFKEYNVNISGLIDSSRGTGVETKWKKSCYKDIRYGYAGGLGPGNLKKKLKELDQLISRDEVTWVDMETNIRKDNWFCIDRVKQCLKEAKQYL